MVLTGPGGRLCSESRHVGRGMLFVIGLGAKRESESGVAGLNHVGGRGRICS